MSTQACAAVHGSIEAIADGQAPTAAEQAHLDGCATCQARLALARRVNRMLTEWPVAAPAPDFSQRVAALAQRETWRQEQVVDWGFNIAIAAGLAAVVAGFAGAVWMLASTAGSTDATRVLVDATGELMTRVRGQLPVAGAAMLLLSTALGTWWWAEERLRW